MKIIYCICSLYNPGGMERVLLNKVRYLKEKMGWDVSVVTTDQHGRPTFYPFPEGVRIIDLGINYTDDNGKSPILKTLGYLRRRRKHRKALTELLFKERPDIVDSLYPSESSFIPAIQDGSRKVLELHFNRFFRLQYRRHGLLGLSDRLRSRQDERIVRKFDSFVVLTEEDKGYWGNLPNIEAIPNAANIAEATLSDCSAHRVIAVGRLDYQKGFDRLIEAWSIIKREPGYSDWQLDIFGQGEWKEMLENMIVDKGLTGSARINKPTNEIWKEYSCSSLIVMTSHFEGFGMVLVEAMLQGVPAVAFDCKCGPKDIIDNGKNGLLAPEGDVPALAEAMMKIMSDDSLRRRMGEEALKIKEKYSEEKVMERWIQLFNQLM
jgi:glycosyltransferase involved in cell wall biosynthesis